MAFSDILRLLPSRASCEVKKYREDVICEIRLRAGRPMTLTTPASNLLTEVVLSAEELAETVERICGGSLHAFEGTLKEGYLPLPDGCRVGVCGSFSGGTPNRFSSLNIRIPRGVKGVGLSLCRRLISAGKCGLLVFSPPGEGKTTLLRDMAATLSSPPYLLRVALIDSRCELFREDSFQNSIADVYSGCPKPLGIELATRTMSPQLLVCDELGAEEAEQVLAAQNAGVPLLASAHASSYEGLMRRPAFRKLDEAGVFGLYVGLRREGRGYCFDIRERKEGGVC